MMNLAEYSVAMLKRQEKLPTAATTAHKTDDWLVSMESVPTDILWKLWRFPQKLNVHDLQYSTHPPTILQLHLAEAFVNIFLQYLKFIPQNLEAVFLHYQHRFCVGCCLALLKVNPI